MSLSKRPLSEESGNQGTKWRRSYRACVNCRSRKIKCDLGPLDNPHKPPCVRCKREQRECIFPVTKRRDVTAKINNMKGSELERSIISSILPDVDKKSLNGGGSAGSDLKQNNIRKKPTDSNWQSDISTMQTALEFLANAVGVISKSDTRSLLNLNQNNTLIENEDADDSNPNNDNSEDVSRSDSNTPKSRNSIFSLIHDDTASKVISPLMGTIESIRPKPTRNLSDIEYIGPNKLLTEDEARTLINVFFLTMHPYFPYIPLQLHNPDELVRYPILLCAILTVSSRYNSFNEIFINNEYEKDRNIVVHEKLWFYCQRLISNTIWAEASTRSIGTILAFLLFTEWNPRAIHWTWSDYGNNPELTCFTKNNENNMSEFKGEKTTGFEAMRHSDRMAWMFTGSAVRLAQDMHFIDNNYKIFMATHISETFNAMNVNQRSTLSDSLSNINLSITRSHGKNNDDEEGHIFAENFGNEQYYLEQILKHDKSKEKWIKFLKEINSNKSSENSTVITDAEREYLNDEYILYYQNNNPETQPTWGNHSVTSTSLPYPLKFASFHKAKIEILRIMSIAYETIYSAKNKRVLAFNNQRQNLAVLSIFSPLIESWYSNHHGLLKLFECAPCDMSKYKDKNTVQKLSQAIEKESLIGDYYYCQLYIYSLALKVDIKDNNLNLSEITKSAKYVYMAYNAAKEILTSAVRVNKLKLLRYLPVRWVTRILRSVAFIVKCFLLLTESETSENSEINAIIRLSGIPVDEALELIETTSVTLNDASPDELHLCKRYSSILLYMCKELRNKTQNLYMNEGVAAKQENADVKVGNKSLENLSSIENSQEPIEPFIMNEHPQTELPINTTEQIAIVGNEHHGIEQTPILNPNSMSFQGEVIDWFSSSADIGLEFVESWTEMIEQMYLRSSDGDQNIHVNSLFGHMDRN
ncbi:hypothetical protein Kpol_1028p82 [Vanderwaltozyma polyspora DSM 70294]|uniref:Zn(2)-C6 fungal-type domain-containing protein n=1 Tax=Vanderwaltozyma polyspora (strain ATCC 22028 / DSM 70294 / BCRC 21397 / CBS 2163 / NBRC 10782 / NRRL Y-8283 / UCD 57-17) TaxID=436907 RepID=A7TG49_VANPO|nr:uncharacterized protein Kpol_1028p82 [Vanderwaltozyma polyspora DSM 70294]EDO18806.1 hypothetical protein Kpol_1028p82 [Vanderwaltozyma polyspora DSM 70294]